MTTGDAPIKNQEYEKDKMEKWLDRNIETTMVRMRYVTLIPVIFSYIGALIMFVVGTMRAYNAVLSLFATSNPDAWDSHLRDTQVNLILAVDAYLMGLVLLIFSYGIYDLFISSMDAGNQPKIRPRWMTFDDIGGLKTILAEVILIILTIEFFQLVLASMPMFDTFEELLVIPIGMLLIAVGLGVFKKLTHGGEKENGTDPCQQRID